MKIICILIIVFFSACMAENREKKEDNNVYQRHTERRAVSLKREETLGEASTKIIDTGVNRISNIELVCNRISGMEIVQGAEFSFNSTTGKKTAENGYKYAPVIIDGEKSYGIGGGVCQVSTTIYQAALNAGMKITEHHNHSEPVAYAPQGTDATVVFGVKDFKFVNNSGSPVYIYVWVENEQVFAKIIKRNF